MTLCLSEWICLKSTYIQRNPIQNSQQAQIKKVWKSGSLKEMGEESNGQLISPKKSFWLN